MHIPTFHQPAPVLRDPFSIGQQACARIRAEEARKAMHRCAHIAFDFRIDPEDDADSVMGKSQAASLVSIYRFSEMERSALAILRGAR